ncbi:hypothetical protein TTHERM_00399570 (macronuclear) [Tetrahymena thermophila SB210]|uniref:Uncharacterized protein n=1 Tax=Tetrahymena thermophila (strain SB210) TaxID=312017 RepID=I7LUH5_TETTS|nr:hypothetical protein TTHERM_00399570 [Tetrahymena thermophila SB210]EAR93784.2 hypothetical protein TTHERM_00399570 [Tetrahymena thermophila SB210]|eukprot:XP_001014029.2 hypothetical protein TTHERM_00399570 [Tetrahymena thermophila SB210]
MIQLVLQLNLIKLNRRSSHSFSRSRSSSSHSSGSNYYLNKNFQLSKHFSQFNCSIFICSLELREEKIEAEAKVEEGLQEAAKVVVEKIVERGMEKTNSSYRRRKISESQRKKSTKNDRNPKKAALVKIRNQKIKKERILVYLLKNKPAREQQKLHLFIKKIITESINQFYKNLIKKIKIFKIKKALKWGERIYLEQSQQQQEEK